MSTDVHPYMGLCIHVKDLFRFDLRPKLQIDVQDEERIAVKIIMASRRQAYVHSCNELFTSLFAVISTVAVSRYRLVSHAHIG